MNVEELESSIYREHFGLLLESNSCCWLKLGHYVLGFARYKELLNGIFAY